MATDTSKSLRNQIIYSVFVRNYSEAGTFEEVRRDLARIKALGTDIIWLMPIHPLGAVNRKGSLGSPYANRDYRAINPEFGTPEDFRRLTDDIHALGMRVIIDVVYNHTSPDSVLAAEHPEWFYHKPDGSFGNKVGEWWDVVDLDYSNEALWDYQIESLCMWARYVDGFRCDVAPLLPLEFWQRARAAVAVVRPNAVWLAESVDSQFVQYLRSRGIQAWTDAEGYQAFDLEYEYDIYHVYREYLAGECALADYCREINRQEVIYPDNYVKLRCLENHDRERAAYLFPDGTALRNWTAFLYFQKGAVLLYNGQEAGCTHLPTLFDKDTIDWSGLTGSAASSLTGLPGAADTATASVPKPAAKPADSGNKKPTDLTPLLRRLAEIKRDPLFADSTYYVNALPGDVAAAVHTENEWLPDENAPRKGGAAVGFFTLKAPEYANGSLTGAGATDDPAGGCALNRVPGNATVDLRSAQTGDGRTLDQLLPDGAYSNEIDGSAVTVAGGSVTLAGAPVIIRIP